MREVYYIGMITYLKWVTIFYTIDILNAEFSFINHCFNSFTSHQYQF